MTSANFDDRNIFVSPFLNFDPSILISNPEEQFIFPEGEKRRGRFERSFSEIGAMVIGGASVGGIKGLYSSLKDSELKNLPTLSVRRTQMLNHMTKSGATLAQTTGSIGLIYALADFLIHKLRRGADDEINTITAATATGLVYASPGMFKPGGWKRCGFGSATGFAVGAVAVTFMSWSRIKHLLGG
ncbi:Mitochondrial import inner membrane translocase subunit Tim23 isoform 2 [Schistosoma japonicum]|uniref:Mitochondrial import inner membrane translocase subunit Tim23 n=1 Tax=Schistosoma japonicum TaxID=6182 RepID=C1LFR1_SCHJA|nr:Mitochondrial import inner membrane translocase subunit Tim23 [Schistosoma japonicum]KAH8865418.1 Mitochondrial import inner membrane translocase subunit Tim23 [Schistosoma japonicum]KAH8865419.1 Mitochondrial import inner membrane translocase subunit Tim23 [Schistosoma japonicum]KAH8865421.1 Mitochondrial import inner membrane translocase subunit Tim23 [Schistosoma japonicum]KAH8865424.1 Mitochondrial import inner membrane translocase subunit Tim23 [Schistosoma japonicum]